MNAFLYMQAVFRFISNDTLRTIDYFSTYFFAAVCKQTMHKQRVNLGIAHYIRVYALVSKCFSMPHFRLQNPCLSIPP